MNTETLKEPHYWSNPDYDSGTPKSPFAKPLHHFMEFFLENENPAENRFIRLYDKIHFPMEGIWLFGVAQFKDETPEQLQNKLGLPFVPQYICDVFVKPHQRVLMYKILDNPAVKEGEAVCQVEKGLQFVNERPLRPDTPIRQQLSNQLGKC